MIGDRLSMLLATLQRATGIDAFEHGEWLPVLVLAALLPLALSFRPAGPALAWPLPCDGADTIGRRGRERQRLASGTLRTLCLLCLAGVLCGPLAQRKLAPEPGLGLDLVLVLDASESMGERDAALAPDDASGSSRLRLARSAVGRFARRRVEEGDRVGLVVFGEHAYTACPLTSDGALLRAAVERVEVGIAGNETALGDALALAVKRVSADMSSEQRVVVLLTDGRSNAGSIPVAIASELARAADIRVHTVGIGIDGATLSVRDASSIEARVLEKHSPDARTLGEVAERTGGRFFAARNALDLQAVYAEIDGIERRRRPLPPRITERSVPEPMLAAAFSLLFIDISAVRIWRRRLP